MFGIGHVAVADSDFLYFLGSNAVLLVALIAASIDYRVWMRRLKQGKDATVYDAIATSKGIRRIAKPVLMVVFLLANTPAYKRIDSEKWNILLPVSEDMAKQLKDNEYIKIRFCKDDFTLTVPYSLTKKDGSYYVNLSLKTAHRNFPEPVQAVVRSPVTAKTHSFRFSRFSHASGNFFSAFLCG